MSLLSYEEYKESGVEWLGKVPSHWKLSRLKDIAKVINGFPFDSKLFETNGPHELIRIRDLNATQTAIRYSGEFLPAASVTTSDVLIGMDGDFNVGRWFGKQPALLNQRMCCVRTPSTALSIFLLHSLPIPLAAINDVTYSTTVKHLSSLEVERIQFALPPDEELSAIATFLECETAKIDALIAEQEKLIALLAEKRQATISHAVIRGLDSNAPMKDSGVAWLGEVPAHWQIRRMKTICPEITVGIVVEPSKYYVDDGIPALRSLNIIAGRIVTENFVYISEESNNMLTKSQLKAGDLVSVRSGQTGTTAVVPKELDGCNCIDLIILRRPLADCGRFLCWYFASDSALRQFAMGSGGAIQQHFNVGMAMNMLAPIPPIEEQEAIAYFLDCEASKLDGLCSEAERGIRLLKERRSALIAAAITGQIDVRDIAQQTAA